MASSIRCLARVRTSAGIDSQRSDAVNPARVAEIVIPPSRPIP